MPNFLGDLISRGEGGYNSYNRGTYKGHIVPPGEACDFSVVTLGELTKRQALPPGDPQKVFAVGKYQVIPTTMQAAIDNLHLDSSERYTPELQERIFADYLIKSKRHPIFDYIVGKTGSSLHAAQKSAAQEWASIDDPDTPGRPYGDYGKHGNRSSIRAASIAEALNGMRDAYADALRRDISESDAWHLVAGGSQTLHRQEADHASPKKIVERLEPHPSIMAGIQQSLRALGYGGMHDALDMDGHIGPNTLHAIKSFQHAHHLHVDGIVGPRTLAALEDAKHYPLLSEATNPHHHLYAQVVAGIHALPRDVQPTGRALENAAVSLTISAATSGLQRVDHVVLGSNGVNLFAVQGRMDDPAHRRTHVELAHAVVHASDHRPLTAIQPTQAHAHAHSLAVAQHQAAPRAPVIAGP